MEPAKREVVLRMLFPSLGVLLVYMLALSRGGELNNAQTALEGARASAVSQESLFPVRDRLDETTAELVKLKQEKGTLDGRWKDLAALPASSSTSRTAALRQLTKMLWDRGLYPFEESPADVMGQMPASFDEMLKKVSTPGASSQSRLWQIRFYGRYSDVAQTLGWLGELNHLIVPISLTMSEAKMDTAWRVWTLVLWV